MNSPGKHAKVAIVRCAAYDHALVENAVRRGIDLIGGIDKFARRGERILFKPNVLWGTDPARSIVTHPAVLRGAAAVFSGTGAVMRYGDSPAGLPNATSSIKKCGYHHALGSIPAELVSFDEGVDLTYPEGIAGKKLRIARAVHEADGVVNLPKLKTHGLIRMTGAVKNCFGCIPGISKGECHARFPDPYEFSVLLADIAAFIRPRLHIMDAIEAMEGNGPQSGNPKKLGALLVSDDPVALDAVACRLIDLDPSYVPTIATGIRAGLGRGGMDEIDIVGDDITPLIDRSFHVVRMPPVRISTTGILGGIKRFILPRPAIVRTRCTRCGRCISACPLQPSALSRNRDDGTPRYDYRTCIRCYCCQEVCPSKAIVIKRSVSGRVLPFASYVSLFISRARSRRSGS